ncbi:MAG: radical SAM protein [Chitinivibrionales bacterium]|nr:radical SAM protein [Chitinivibrionales bacterium]
MVDIRTIPCRTALTGDNHRFRLNPYVGCTHRCAYCYATYVAGYRDISEPWGSWVLVKRDIVPLLQLELTRARGAHVFMSTTCDVYQPLDRRFALTRQCLEALHHAALFDPDLRVFLLTKSDDILRDRELLASFPPGTLEVGFSLTTHRDEIARLVEPGAPSPTRRIDAARELVRAGLHVQLLICPVLPHITETDLPALVDIARSIGVAAVAFDKLNYLERHVGKALRPVYERLGEQACRRLAQAHGSDAYEREITNAIASARGRFAR